MRFSRAMLAAGGPLMLFTACSAGQQQTGPTAGTGGAVASTGTGTTTRATGGSGGSGATACVPCVTDQDCPGGAKCGQFGGDTYCAPACTQGACPPDRACTLVTGADGKQDQLCIPVSDVCGTGMSGSTSSGAGTTGASSSAGATGASSSAASSGAPASCGSLQSPDTTACCVGCQAAQQPCQANGCYGGWWCNADTCHCQQPPASCGGGTSSSSSSSSSASSSGSSSGGGVTGISGGKLDRLTFAIVGDTRPAVIEDTAAYPKAVIQKIWQDVEAYTPRPAFAVTTGDYMFAKPSGSQAAPQLDIYLAARAAFTNLTFPTMGNHECTGATTSNCGAGNTDGITNNYTQFMAKMLAPLGVTKPYYALTVNATDGSWSAKFLFVAANAWDAAQASWLTTEMGKPTTYTFVVRHEGIIAPTAPGVTPSGQIMKQFPYTLLLAGHTHTFGYHATEREIITGNGGAPLTGSIDYGYVIAEQRTDGAIVFTEIDYSTNAVQQTFAVLPDGTPTQ